jgi:hypothetical protein
MIGVYSARAIVNEDELNALLTSAGFFRFLASQTKLDEYEVKRIYLLGIPWGLWPRELDVSHEAAEAEVSLFTYLAALQPLIDLDTVKKEAELVAYEGTLAGRETILSIAAVRAEVSKVLALSGSDENTICSLLHALYEYRQRVCRLCVHKVVETSRHKGEQEQAASNAKAQSVLMEQRRASVVEMQRARPPIDTNLPQ